MLGPSLAHIPPDACIVVVGSVGAILHRYAPPDARVYSLVNASVVQCVGQVPDATLSALIWGARAMIVPIVSGGGSNLKTAEAIASFRPVIATSFACRGYEFARSLQSFFVRDDPADFSAAVDRILSEDLQDVACSESERALRESVFWERTLSPMRRVLM